MRRLSLRADGVTLGVEERGAGPPVALLHGFAGSAQGLAPLARTLARRHRVLAIDLIGHGASDAPRDPAAYAIERCAEQLACVLAAAGAAPAHVFGYSMGGRAALALALAHPEAVRSLALLGASAGLSDAAARARRRRDDEALAERIERDGVAAFAREWAALPIFASQRRRLSPTARRALERQRLANRAHGLAGSLRGMGSGAQPCYLPRLAELDLPVWLGHGAEDAKFEAIARELAERLPRARRCAIPAAGHAPHLENPDALERELERFFGESSPEAIPRPPPSAVSRRGAQGARR